MRANVSKPKVFKTEKVPALPDSLSEAVEIFLQDSREKNLPLDFEFGSGAGVHSIRYAREHPGRALISVEKTREKFEKFLSRIDHHEALANLLPLHANAISVMTHAISKKSLQRFFLWYPNPFPEKARFVRTPFFEFLLTRIAVGGEFYFATNVESYFLESVEFFSARTEFTAELSESFDRNSRADFKPRTLFEKKYFLRGEKLYELKLRKN